MILYKVSILVSTLHIQKWNFPATAEIPKRVLLILPTSNAHLCTHRLVHISALTREVSFSNRQYWLIQKLTIGPSIESVQFSALNGHLYHLSPAHSSGNFVQEVAERGKNQRLGKTAVNQGLWARQGHTTYGLRALLVTYINSL